MTRPSAKSLLRLGVPAVAVLTLALSGCGDPAPPAPDAPAASATPSNIVPLDGPAGSDGLTVRYLDDDGTVRTVGVEDLPR